MIDGEYTDEELHKNYIKAVDKELLKIFSKMGISTLQSYRGAQIFECIGLNKSVVDKFFTGTVSRIEGLGLEEIAKECMIRHTSSLSLKFLFKPKIGSWWGLSMETKRREAHFSILKLSICFSNRAELEKKTMQRLDIQEIL